MEVFRLFFLACLFWQAFPKCPNYGLWYFRRLGNSRFYVWHYRTGIRDNETDRDWATAWEECASVNMSVARIDKITTFSEVSIGLGELNQQNATMDTYYWLAAKYDYKMDTYRWYSNKTKPTNEYLRHANFFFRQHRPVGVGSYWRNDSGVRPDRDVPQCLIISLPLPGINDKKNKHGIYGSSVGLEEYPCESRKTFHVMCEVLPECVHDERHTMSPYELAEGQESYFDDGNWIFGDRKYILSWAQRNKRDAEAYCKTLGLKLYSPTNNDQCLVPYIKMWSRNLTYSSYWTNWRYFPKNMSFIDGDGKSRAQFGYNYTQWNESSLDTRSHKTDSEFCAAMVHNYEFREQFPCSEKNQNKPSACRWHFLQFIPANCNNTIGTICQHDDYKTRSCVWKKEYIPNITKALYDTAVTDFGYKGNTEYMRSTYKQTFGHIYCPPGYSLVVERNQQWHAMPSGKSTFLYDYRETYWVVDKERFNKTGQSMCSVSKPVGGHREIRRVPCYEWHFYLCKRRSTPGPTSSIKPPQYAWNDRPTPREEMGMWWD